MSSVIASGLHKVQGAVQGASSGEKKVVDLARDTADVHAKTPFTTDHGMKVSNTDNWLRAVDENQTGPSLLEDQIAREKVSSFFIPLFLQFSLF